VPFVLSDRSVSRVGTPFIFRGGNPAVGHQSYFPVVN
jgi:hypothetical protein